MSLPGLSTIQFGEPRFLWLLAAPGALFLLWSWMLARHIRDRRRFSRRRQAPIRERFTLFAGLLSWLFLLAAMSSTIFAVARPKAAVPLVRTGGVDLVILQDGSASMRVTDVRGNRWQRSMRFLRTLGESLRWKDDRIAMAVFAHVAEPQIRLTKDPNTYFFFLDHLDHESPFRLEDDTTWDTNTELGLYWGMRLIEKDEQLHGLSSNAKAFVLISDGQSWSGEVARSIAQARQRRIPIFAVGVGTTLGGRIPEPPTPATSASFDTPGPPRSSLDRSSLVSIATAGNGEYLELDRETDREIGNRIISAARRRSTAAAETGAQDLYWPCLLMAAIFIGIGIAFVHDRAELWLSLAGVGAALAVVWTLTA